MKSAVLFLSGLLLLPFAVLKASADDLLTETDYDLIGYFIDAAAANDTELVQAFLSAGMPVNIQSKGGHTALIIAASHGHKEIVSVLLESGADACLRDFHGNSPVSVALFMGEIHLAGKLMSEPCNTNQINNSAQNVAAFAALPGQAPLHQLLYHRQNPLTERVKF